MTRSRREPADGTAPPPEPDSGRVHLSNEGSTRRSVVVVVRGPDGRASAERVDLPSGSVARLRLPVSADDLTVGCHTDDGRSGVCTYRPGESGPVGFTLLERTVLLDLG